MDDLILEMIAPERRSDLGRGRRLRLVATALIVALATIGVTSLVTGALFTDTQPVSAGDFTTGTVDIRYEGSIDPVPLLAGTMAPGDVVYGVVPVANRGSLQLRYAVEVTGTNDQLADLAGQLQLKVYAGVTCSPEGVSLAAPIATSAGLLPTSTPLFGSSETGQDTGDRVLSAGAAEELCVSVGLPRETENEFQNTNAAVELTFLAEQTVNNP